MLNKITLKLLIGCIMGSVKLGEVMVTLYSLLHFGEIQCIEGEITALTLAKATRTSGYQSNEPHPSLYSHPFYKKKPYMPQDI